MFVISLLISGGWGILPNYDHVIHVDPSNPDSVNNVSCYDQSNKTPCKDINFALAFPNRGQSTNFVLSSLSTHYLANNESTTMFSESSSVAFSGNNGTAVVECMDGAGLAFLNSTNITFHGVSFQKCGAWRDSTSRDFAFTTFLQLKRIRVGLYFYNCRDVTMVKMSVLNSTEAVGVVMYSTAGVNYIARSQFDGNRISESNKNESGGGGFAVEFNYCKPGDNSCNEANHQTENNKNTVYTFEHCSFSNNRAIDQSGQTKTGVSILPINQTHSSLGRGGGLSVYFKAAAFNNHVRIHNCTFHRNHANWGGGLCVQYADHSIQNQVVVTESVFITNHCNFELELNKSASGTLGGGVLVSSPVHYDFPPIENLFRNSIVFNESSFFNNRAITGGALAFVYTLQRLSQHNQTFLATILNSDFSSNQARLGSAVAVDHEYFFHQGELGEMLIANSRFIDNTIVYSNTDLPYSVGVGALYIAEVKVTFQGYTNFMNNTGSALALVGTKIVFNENSSFVFSGNQGANGGAIALLGGSSMLIGENMQMLFEENSASQFGGAIYNIYVGKEDLRSSVKCFIQYYDPFSEPKNWNARFEFRGNTAGHLGNSIFSSTILPCSWSEDLQAGPDVINEIFCWNASNWIYENSNCSNEIYTFPQYFTGISSIRTYPGHRFHLNITTRDDLDHDVTTNTIYTALIKNASGIAEIDPSYSYVSNGSIGITGEENQNMTVQLDVAWHRAWRIDIPVELLDCPLGFNAQTIIVDSFRGENMMKALSKCECIGGEEVVTFGGKLICEKASMVSKISNGFWMGLIPRLFNNTYVMASTKWLLKNKKENFLNLSDEDSQCSHLNRKGPLCGECIDGHSTAVNSYNYECVPCTSNTTNLAANWAKYIGLSYVPYLFVFFVMILLDWKLQSGSLVVFILYAQLVSSGVFDLTIGRFPNLHKNSHNFSIPFIMQKAYRTAYGVFNLNSFSKLLSPFCVHEDHSALDVIRLDYFIALFLALLIMLAVVLLLVYKLLRKLKRRGIREEALSDSSKEGRGFKFAVVRFLSFSYTRLSLDSALLLSWTGVILQDGSYIESPSLMYFAGQYTFYDHDYFVHYGLIAIIFFIIIGIIPPLILLLGSLKWCFPNTCQEKYKSQRCPCKVINFFLDAFTSHYKPKYRCFGGLYFFFRLAMLCAYAFTHSAASQVLCQLTIIIVMIVLAAAFPPHKNFLCSTLDVLILLNMAGIAAVSIYLYMSPLQLMDTSSSFGLYYFGLVLVWLPMLCLALCSPLLILYKIWKAVTACRRQSVEVQSEETRHLLEPGGKSTTDYSTIN